MATKHDGNGTKGLFDGIVAAGRVQQDTAQQTGEEKKKNGIKELKSKRSYELKNTTIKKLQEMKMLIYPDPCVKYNDIVDEAICALYEAKKGREDE